MLQINVTAQATVLAEAQIFHRQLLGPMPIYSGPTRLLSVVASGGAVTTDTIMATAHRQSPEVWARTKNQWFSSLSHEFSRVRSRQETPTVIYI